jgi:hypothetical protein
MGAKKPHIGPTYDIPGTSPHDKLVVKISQEIQQKGLPAFLVDHHNAVLGEPVDYTDGSKRQAIIDGSGKPMRLAVAVKRSKESGGGIETDWYVDQVVLVQDSSGNTSRLYAAHNDVKMEDGSTITIEKLSSVAETEALSQEQGVAGTAAVAPLVVRTW